MFFDTHAHINFKEFKDDGDKIVKKTLESGVCFINVGAEYKTSKRAIEYASRYTEGVFAAVGLHPSHIWIEEFFIEKYRELALNKKVVAIGEIGLDYYRIDKNQEKTKEKQKEIFKKQIELALELDKPIIIHCRDAHDDVLEILNSYFKIHKSKLRGIAHSFLGNYKQARKYRQMGFKIAFNGIITFARDYDKVILDTPIEDIVLETDCPYLTPVPYRGKRNEPLYVIEVAKKIAELKNLSLEKVAKETTKNAKKIFNL
ncbi:TatD family hydrolase [Candidatus Wolfebacteria bacterium]|nr:TatD family hydrolase [Candidatus Wolfebacteria bacterium]